MDMDMKVKFMDWKKANGRCKCGKCNHHILEVCFDNNNIWCPTNQEVYALNEMLKIVIKHNLLTDKRCFKKKQKIQICEVFNNGV